MIYNLNIIPTIKDENNQSIPYAINYTLALFLSELLENNISIDNPYLEYRVSQELKSNGQTELSNIELDYIKNIVNNLQINNLLKGQILDLLSSI